MHNEDEIKKKRYSNRDYVKIERVGDVHHVIQKDISKRPKSQKNLSNKSILSSFKLYNEANLMSTKNMMQLKHYGSEDERLWMLSR